MEQALVTVSSMEHRLKAVEAAKDENRNNGKYDDNNDGVQRRIQIAKLVR